MANKMGAYQRYVKNIGIYIYIKMKIWKNISVLIVQTQVRNQHLNFVDCIVYSMGSFVPLCYVYSMLQLS